MSESLSPVYANTYEYKLMLFDAKQQHSSKFSKVKQNTSTITNKTSAEQKRLVLR